MPTFEVEANFQTGLRLIVEAESEEKVAAVVSEIETQGYVSSGHVSMAGSDYYDLLEDLGKQDIKLHEVDVSYNGNLEVGFIVEDESGDYNDDEEEDEE